jgi:hypothetical protein
MTTIVSNTVKMVYTKFGIYQLRRQNMEKPIAAVLSGLLLVSIIVPAIGLVTSFSPVVSAQDISGNATIQSAAPLVENATAPAQVSPNSSVNFTVDIQDNNTIANLENVELWLFSNSVLEGDPDNARNHYTFYWQENDNTWHEIGPDLGGTHINAGSSVAPDNSQVNSSITFNIKLDKIAEPSAWTAKFYAYDNSSSGSNSTAFNVNQYIELSSLSSNATWTNLSVPSENNAADTNPHQATIISNDNYRLDLKLSGDWTSGLNIIGTDNTKFNSVNDTATSTVFSTTYQTLFNNQSWTSTRTHDIYFWLTVPVGIRPGTYTTTFNVQVTFQ